MKSSVLSVSTKFFCKYIQTCLFNIFKIYAKYIIIIFLNCKIISCLLKLIYTLSKTIFLCHVTLLK